MSSALQVPGVEMRGEWREGYEQVLTEESLALLARLQREFGPRRAELADDFVELLTLPAYERIAQP